MFRNLILSIALLAAFSFAEAQSWRESYSQSLQAFNQDDYDKAFGLAQQALRQYISEDGSLHKNYLSILRNVVNSAYASGNFTDGISFAQQEIKLRDEMLLPKDEVYATALFNLGSLYMTQENLVDAIKYLGECYKIVEQFYRPGDEAWLECKWKLAAAYYLSDDKRSALKHFEESFRFISKQTSISTDYISARVYYAQLQVETGKYTEALPVLIELDEIYRDNDLEDEAEYADILAMLAEAYHANKDYNKSDAYYAKAIPALAKTRGTNSKAYNNAQYRRAMNLNSMGKAQESAALIASLDTEGADAAILNNLAALSQMRRDFEKAELYFKRAMSASDKSSPASSKIWLESAENLALLFIELNRFKEAEDLLKESVQLSSQIYTQEHERYASSLLKQATLYRGTGRFNLADKNFEQAFTIFQNKDLTQTEQFASLLASGAVLFQFMGDYRKSEELFIQSMTLYESLGQKTSRDYTTLLNNFAVLEQLQGRYLNSRDLFLEVVELTNAQHGEESPLTASAIENLAQTQLSLGVFDKAEELLNRSLQIREKVYGKQHPVYAGNLLSIGKLKQQKGEFNEAEPIFINARNIIIQSQGQASADFAQANNALALFYQSLGNYAEAEPLFTQSKDIFLKLYGNKNRDYATSLANLATLYELTNRPQDAIRLLNESLAIDAELLGTNHPGYAVGLHNLASLNQKSGKYEEAKKLFEQALIIYEKAFGPNTLSYANTLTNLGVLYQDLKEFDKAEQALRRSVEIKKEKLGLRHPDYAYSIYSLASFYQFTNRRAEAAPLFDEVISNYLTQVAGLFPSMSEKEKSAFYAKIRPIIENYQDFAIEYYKESPNSRKEVLGKLYDLQLSTKALLLNASNKVRERIISGNDQQLKDDYQQWIQLKEQLVKYYNYSLDELTQESIDLRALEAKANSIEKQLSSRSTLFASEYEKVLPSWKEVKNKLNPDEVAVEIIRIRKKYIKDSIVYAALIIGPHTNDAPELIIYPYGNKLETRFYNYYRNSVRFNMHDTLSSDHYFVPIRPALKNASKIYISLDGIFNKININTLWDNATDMYAVEEFTIRLLSNTNELLKPIKTNPIKIAAIYGDPDFGSEQAVASARTQRLTRSRLFDSFSGHIEELPGTREETKRLNELLLKNSWNTNVFLREQASVANFKKMQSPRLLHIATHGFFMPDLDFEKDSNFGIHMQSDQANPLFRSGLLLAGSMKGMSGQTLKDEEDGILTAYEAMNLNLDETELIVLSACETGLGDIRNGEGVYGLQRAFIVAGAKNLIMSLWKVDDETTQQLMNTFYDKWIGGMEKSQAFREAQQEIKEKHPEPYFWGAFVMLGI